MFTYFFDRFERCRLRDVERVRDRLEEIFLNQKRSKRIYLCDDRR